MPRYALLSSKEVEDGRALANPNPALVFAAPLRYSSRGLIIARRSIAPMSRGNRVSFRVGTILALGLVFLFTLAVLAEDLPFAGKWKGEMKITAPPAGAP